MKNRYYFITIILLLLSINVKAVKKDGWHLLPSSTNAQTRVWAYYKNGEEKLRYSKMIYVHGGWNTTPEDSLASLKVLKNNGYYALTVDINFTKDDIPVLIHNDTINWVARNSDLSEIRETLYVKNMTLEEIKKYDFVVSGTGKVLSNYKGNKITTYEEALDYCKKNGLTLEVEIKEGTKAQIKKIVELTQKYNMDGVIRWTSFNITHLKYINEFDDNEMLQLLTFSNSYQEIDNEYNKHNLKNGKNTLLYTENDGSFIVPDMPEEQAKYPMENYKLKTIPRANIYIDNTLIENNGNRIIIPFKYGADGKVKCKSENETIAKCSIDQDNKKLIIDIINDNIPSFKITIWGTQGIKYSATKLKTITVNNQIKATRITLNKNNTTLKIDDSEKLTYKLEPENVTNKKVAWISSNPNIVTVNNGVIKAINTGEAIITVMASNEIKDECKVTVIDNKIPVTNIKVNKTNLTLNINESEKLIITIEPANATDKSLIWTSSNPNVATVDNGLVKALNVGETTITIKSSNNQIITCDVIVKDKDSSNNNDNGTTQTIIEIIAIIIVIILIIKNILSIKKR